MRNNDNLFGACNTTKRRNKLKWGLINAFKGGYQTLVKGWDFLSIHSLYTKGAIKYMTTLTKLKKCIKCGEEKGIENFVVKRSAKDGINPKCKDCVCEYQNNRNKRPDVHSYNKNKSQKRRAFLNELPHAMTAKQWNEVKSYFNNHCFLTGEVLSESNLSIEHVIPLCTGHGGHIVENVLPLDKSLNMSRQDKNIFEWFNTLGAREEMKRCFDEAIGYLAFMNDMKVDEYKEYIYYCDTYRRTIDEVKADRRPSIEIFKEWKAEEGRI